MKYFFLTYLMLLGFYVFGQNRQKIDSLKTLLNSNPTNEHQIELNLEISKLIQNKEPDSSKVYAKKAEQLAIKINNNDLLGKSYLQEGFIFYRLREDDFSLNYFNKIDSLYTVDKSILESYFMSKIYRSEISKFTFTMEGVMQAKDYILEALKLAEEDNNDRLINLAKYRLAEWHGFISQEVSPQAHLDSATTYIQEVIPYYKRIKDYDFLAKSYQTLASIALETKDYKSVEKFLKIRLQILKKTQDSIQIGQAYSSFGTLYRNMKEPDKGIIYLDSAYAIFGKTGFSTPIRRKDLYRDYAYLYELKKDYKNAFFQEQKALVLKDSIYEIENTKRAMELEKKYQTQKKEHKIELLKSQNELEKRQKINQRNVLLGGLILTSMAGLFLFILYRDHQKTNTKLKELDTLKSNFFTNISHEFRTPLTLISGPIQEVLEDTSLSEKRRSQFEMAQRNSNRLLLLVNQLLDLSKIDSGNLKLHIQEGNVLRLISGLCDSFSYMAEQKEIDYHKTIEPGKTGTWFDRDAVEKIVVNLLSNAMKYTPDKGSVVCHAFVRDEKLNLEIKNTGTVLTPEELNRIFQRFYQTNEQNRGSGIGLALVKELIMLHKGTITVASEPGQWTIFKVVLPMNKHSFKIDPILSKPDDKKEKVEIPIHSNPEDVIDEDLLNGNENLSDKEQPVLLIVEDNPDMTTLIKQNFEASYTVLTAPNGEKGVALALERVPDLIISDIMMPVKDGISLTKELKNNECTAHIPIILLTAKADTESEFKGIDIGADDYITKPFDKKLLSLKVKKIIETRKKLQLRYSQELILKPKDIAITRLDETFLNKVQEVLDNNLAEASFNIDEFSKAVSMSRMQLHRKLKALTGLSASEFILSQRLKLAAQLLKTSDINISQVGYSVGFNDHAYFSKCFKKMFHCTPTEYAKKQK